MVASDSRNDEKESAIRTSKITPSPKNDCVSEQGNVPEMLYMKRNLAEPMDDVKWRLLKSAEGLRAWKSLDETRQCVLCECSFSGHEVRLFWDGEGAPHLGCPTHGCPATPAQWVHSGNPLVSAEAWNDWVHLLETLCEEPAQYTPKPVFKKRNGLRLGSSAKGRGVALRN